MIIEIGEWVLKQVSACLRHLHAKGYTGLQVSINVSPVQFQNDARLSATWLDHLAGLGLLASSLVIEITEGLLLDVTADVREKTVGSGRRGYAIGVG